jgi:NAD(P) transhydrogenase subunit alpha
MFDFVSFLSMAAPAAEGAGGMDQTTQEALHQMERTGLPELYIFILAAFLGYQLISRVPPLLHTPLMSATNAISGISLVGSIVVAGSQHGLTHNILGAVAVACSTINVVGGFLITDRILKMFRTEDKIRKEQKKS